MKKIDDFVKEARSIAISGHIKPDGDCVGSVLALYNYLEKNYPEKCVDLYLEEPSSKFYFLRNFRKIDSAYEKEAVYDLMITLDCSTKERLGQAVRYFDSACHTICLDHHVSNDGYADENYIFGDASSACEVLYHYLDPDKLDKEIALCLYTGIISDTGVFKYSATSPETMRIAANLMEFGIPTDFVIDEAFYAKDWGENRIMGYAVQHSHLLCDGKVIYSYITHEKMEKFGVTTKELDGIIPQLKLTRGITCAFFLYETGPHQYKVSFRSNAPYDVNEVAKVFGGGGHIRAAGCNVTGKLETCIEAILLEVEKAL